MSESRHNKNLRELFSLYPLECESFGAEWLRRWEAIGKLLDSPCVVQEQDQGGKWLGGEYWSNTGQAIIATAEEFAYYADTISPPAYRVVSGNGAILKEWGV